MATRDLTVRFLGDHSSVDKSVDAIDTKFGKLGTSLKVLAVAGAAVGLALASQLNEAMNIDAGRAKLQAQLGLTRDQAADYGKAAGQIYRKGWGDSLDNVNEAVRLTSQNIGATSTAEMQKIAQSVLVVSQTFGQDLGGVTRAVGNLMRNGLAPDAQTALDIVTKGLQGGVDKSGDFLDTLNEYGTKFRDVGIDGATATGILQQGLQAGARDADKVADAIKEFSIRAIDGSKKTSAGFVALGLDATQMASDIAAGGPRAAAALDLTLDRLRATEDPVKRDAAAVALFGTQAEDLGDALYALDPSQATQRLGDFRGATDRAADAQQTASNTIEIFKRNAIGLATDALGNYVIPAISAVANALWFVLGPAFRLLSDILTASIIPAFNATARFIGDNRVPIEIIAGLIAAVFIPHWVALGIAATINAAKNVAAWVANSASAIWAAAVHSASVVTQVAAWVVLGFQALVQGARIAAGWVLAMGPVGWVIALIVLVAAVIAANWDWVVDKTTKAWSAVSSWISDKWNWIFNAVIRPVGDWIKGVFTGIQGALDVLSGWFWRAVDSIGRKWNELKELAAGPVRFMVNTVWNDGIRKAWNAVTGIFGGKPLDETRLSFARGGGVWGAGTATSDSIPAMLSNNEHVWTSAEVDGAGGHDVVEGMRKAAREGRLAAFAGGGAVWSQLWNIVHGAFGNARLTSSYRPGARDYHGSGEAIDIAGPTPMDSPFMHRVNTWIASNYPNSTELIYTPGINLKNGAPFQYSGGVRADHYNHVHWAMHVPGGAGEILKGGLRGALSMIPGVGTAMNMIDYVGQFTGGVDPFLARMSRATPYDAGVADVARYAADQIKAKVNDLTSLGMGPTVSGGSGVERWRGVVMQALGMMGLPAGWADSTLRRMNQESGGNAAAINNWDINAKRGTPSKGLMQVIDPTFQSNRDPRAVNNIWDPLANILASMRYAMRRYGSLPAAYNRAGGYALGGEVFGTYGSPQMILAHGGEYVVPGPVVSAIKRGSSGGSPVEKHYHLTVVNAANSLVDLEEQFRRMERQDGA